MRRENQWFEPRGDTDGGKIEKIQDILDRVAELRSEQPGSPVWLRGQPHYRNDESKGLYGLRPTIGRRYTYVGKTVVFDLWQERDLLHRFRRHAYAQYNRELEEWETLFLARHHGLPVRLLDWTASPLVALYFAASFLKDEPEDDGAVWAFVRKPEANHRFIDIFDDTKDFNAIIRNVNQMDKDITSKLSPPLNNLNDIPELLRIKGVRVLYPFYASSRMMVQNAAFTIQENPWRSLEDYDPGNIDSFYLDIVRIIKWKVPKGRRHEITDELETANINYRTLFPDLDGLAKGLWQSEVLRRRG